MGGTTLYKLAQSCQGWLNAGAESGAEWIKMNE